MQTFSLFESKKKEENIYYVNMKDLLKKTEVNSGKKIEEQFWKKTEEDGRRKKKISFSGSIYLRIGGSILVRDIDLCP